MRKASNEEFGRKSPCKSWGEEKSHMLGFQSLGDVKHSDITNQWKKK